MVSEKTVYRWISAAKIPFTRVGEQYRFSRQELQVWASSSGHSLSPEIMIEAETKKLEQPSLSQAIENGGIYYCIDGETPENIIDEIMSIIRLPNEIDSEYVRKSIQVRESLASTGIGDGIAVPHMRHPLQQVESPMVFLCFLKQPADWGSMDGKPVNVIFVPCSQSMRTHLHLLSRISFMSREPKFRNLLDTQASRGEILKSLASSEALELANKAKKS